MKYLLRNVNSIQSDRTDVWCIEVSDEVNWERRLENKFAILSIIYTIEEPILQTTEYLHLWILVDINSISQRYFYKSKMFHIFVKLLDIYDRIRI